MERIPVSYQPGTIKNPEHTNITQASFTATDHVHFPNGRLQTIPPYSDVTPDSLTLLGGCRTIHGVEVTDSGFYYMFGTNIRNYCMKNSVLYNMTPFAGERAATLGTDPLALVNTDATMTVTWTAHDLTVGDLVTIAGAEDSGGVTAATYINITHTVATVPDADTFTVELGTTASSTDANAGGSNVSIYSESPAATLGSNPVATRYDNAQSTPFGTTSGSTSVQIVTFLYDEVVEGDYITISGATGTINGIPSAELNDTHLVRGFSGSRILIEVDTPATSTGFPSVAGVVIVAKAVKITHTAHGHIAGDRVKLYGATGPIGGVPASDINKEHVITIVDTADTYIVPVSTDATSFANGGGSAVKEFNQISSGSLDQSFASGYGAGQYGSDLYGADLASDTGIYTYPRIWSYGNFGSDIVMNPGDSTAGDGQKIYIWDANVAAAPTTLTNAPEDCNFAFVLNNAIVALCGNRVDISEIGNGTGWTPGVGSTAYTNTLQRLSRLICGIPYGDKQAVILTENEPLLLRYVGEPDYWDISDIPGGVEGIIGPNTGCVWNGAVYWRGKKNVYRFAGSYVEIVPNDQHGEYLTQELNVAQASKSFVVPDLVHNQLYFHLPLGSDSEPGDYTLFNHSGHWTLGTMERTAGMTEFIGGKLFCANSVSETTAGNVYAHFLSDDTLAVNWSATTAESFAGDGSQRFEVTEFRPDSYQGGDINVTYTTREYPQDATVYTEGPYTVTATAQYVSTSAAGLLRSISFSGAAQTTLGAWTEKIRMLGEA